MLAWTNKFSSHGSNMAAFLYEHPPNLCADWFARTDDENFFFEHTERVPNNKKKEYPSITEITDNFFCLHMGQSSLVLIPLFLAPFSFLTIF